MERLTLRDEYGFAYIRGADVIDIEERYGEAIEKLADYEDAEEQRRLITLPVPIGTRIYYAYKDEIESGVVSYVEVSCDTQLNVNLIMEPDSDDTEFAWFINADQVGKNAFASLEKAKIRQKEKEEKNG